ncbi:YfbM family protein [Paenibacillus xylanexedens]|uniref:YfbM family protein n=1 Tax=Paenibacillus xylanexedens TaxID=528191 RepID=UPI0011A3768A|nr:YfbM family protein [Paenibacillus xylanexedens]
MGMSGRYVVVTDELVESIKSGEVSVHDCPVDLDIDKLWQMLQFTLTGKMAEGEPPLGYVVPLAGEQYLGNYSDMDLFLLTNEQVLEAYMAMEQLDRDELKARFSLQDMMDNDVYPVMEGWDEEATFQEIIQTLDEVQALYQATAGSGNGIVFYIF